MLSTLLLVVAIWALTVPAVLALARVLGRVSAPRPRAPVDAVPPATDNVVALVPRPRNGLVPVPAEARRRAA